VIVGDAPLSDAVVALDDKEIVIGSYTGGLVFIEEPPPQLPKSSEANETRTVSSAVFRDILDVSF
jgi:hypothetical protein